jgi:cell division protein FtsN
MTRHSVQTQAIERHRGGMLLGILIGLVIGVVIAAGVVWYVNKSPLPFQEKSAHPDKPELTPLPPGTPGQPSPLPGKPGDKPVEKPRFDFYKILPGGDATPAPAATPTPDAPPAAATEQFYLQLGAFQKPADADNLKARLALLGVEASVQQIDVPGKGSMQRVRTGPYPRPEDMNRVRNQLAQNGITATLVKIKTPDATPVEPKPAKP